MKPRLILVTLVITFLSLTAFAQPGQGPRDFCKMMDLSEDQQEKISDLRLQHQKEMIPLRSKVQSLRAELKLAQTADRYSESKVKELVGKISDTREEMQLKKLAHKREVRNILTPEQRKKFDLMTLDGRGHGKGKRGHGMRGFDKEPRSPRNERRMQ